MERVKGIISSLINKATSYIDQKDKSSAVLPDESDSSQPESYTMTPGQKLSEEEVFEQNKKIIQTVDPKIYNILLMVNEFNPEMDVIDDMARDSFFMKVWLAHVAYLDKINSFSKLIQGSDGILGYSMLSTKQKKLQKGNSNIKCLTDLPLQKKLLN
jgi:hypothetical protein